ncbi:uncharacterized protein LOC124491167 [Dermatophagoides farinae]|uniref:uncharacterized protein LOC124491167 n=1 Tax=Dermatophagoides farinae TaxID=6954 RepID=UPI003F628AC0
MMKKTNLVTVPNDDDHHHSNDGQNEQNNNVDDQVMMNTTTVVNYNNNDDNDNTHPHHHHHHHRSYCDAKTNVLELSSSSAIIKKPNNNNNNNLFESDRYCNIIREILDSRSINSARSCSTCCSATINSPSSDKSLIITIIDDGDYDDDDDDVKKQNNDKILAMDTQKTLKKRTIIHCNLCDYLHRILRYIKFIDVLFMIASLLFTLIMFLLLRPDFQITNAHSILLFILIWLSITSIYLLYPTFKRWFFYWNPGFSLTRPN